MGETLKEYLVSLGFKTDTAAANKAKTAVKGVGDTAKQAGSNIDKTGKSVNQLAQQLTNLIKVKIISTVLKPAVNYVKNLAKSSIELNKTLEETAKTLKKTVEGARAHQLALSAMGKTYSEIQKSASLKETYNDLVKIGEQLALPEGVTGLTVINDIIDEFTKLKFVASYAMEWLNYKVKVVAAGPLDRIHKRLQTFREWFAGNIEKITEKLAVPIGYVLQIFDSLMAAIAMIKEKVQALPGPVKAALAAIGVAVAALKTKFGKIGLIISLVLLLIDDFMVYLQGGDSLLNPIWQVAVDGFTSVKEYLVGGEDGGLIGQLKEFWNKLKDDGTLANFQTSFENVIGPVIDLAKSLVKTIGKIIKRIVGASTASGMLYVLSVVLTTISTAAGWVVDKLGTVVDKIGEFTDKNPGLVDAILLIAGAFLGAEGLIAAFNALKTAVVAVKAVWTALSLSMNSTKLIIMAIIIAGYLLIKNWDKIKAAAKKVWDKIKEFVVKAWEGIKEVWDGVVKFFKDIWNGIKSSCISVWNQIKTKINGVKTAITKAWDGLTQWFSDLWDGIKTTATKVWQGADGDGGIKGAINDAKDLITGTWDTVTETFSDYWEDIKTNAETAWNTSGGGIQGVFEVAKSSVETTFDGLKTTFSNLWDSVKATIEEKWGDTGIYKAFKDAYDKIVGIWDGIVSYFQGLWDSITGGIIDAINSVLSAYNWVARKVGFDEIELISKDSGETVSVTGGTAREGGGSTDGGGVGRYKGSTGAETTSADTAESAQIGLSLDERVNSHNNGSGGTVAEFAESIGKALVNWKEKFSTNSFQLPDKIAYYAANQSAATKGPLSHGDINFGETTINVYGSSDPEATADATSRKFAGFVSSAVRQFS